MDLISDRLIDLNIDEGVKLYVIPLTTEKHNTEKDKKNTEAIALLEQWDATPDNKPPGYWDDLLEEIETSLSHSSGPGR